MRSRHPAFLDFFRSQYGFEPAGMLTDFLSRRDGRLLLADQVDLMAMVERYGAPLEIVYCPLITQQIARMVGWVERARANIGYKGAFLYAYATKANFTEEVVRTALMAGAHYETSATADVLIAHSLWRHGLLPGDRYIFCNGSKVDTYIDAIVALRHDGFEQIVPIIDDLGELEMLLERCHTPLLLGVRERYTPDTITQSRLGGERFGLTREEILRVADLLVGTPHQLVVYHAMAGSQIEDIDGWVTHLASSAAAYCRLRQHVSTLRMFNFGGGMPTSAYTLNFRFDYGGFFERLMTELAATCTLCNVPHPDIVGEFGRYTTASHSVYLLEVGAVKPGQGNVETWYLVNGSVMVSLPDILIVDGQQFLVLPLNRWDTATCSVRLAGRHTCDSDDFFPRPSQPPLILPEPGEGLIIAVFGVGAYQQMISGRGGVHHCLSPEMRRIVIEQNGHGLMLREVAPQDLKAIAQLLGYLPEQFD